MLTEQKIKENLIKDLELYIEKLKSPIFTITEGLSARILTMLEILEIDNNSTLLIIDRAESILKDLKNK